MFKTYFLDVLKGHYMDFNGRASRQQFWMFVLCYFIIACALAILGKFGSTMASLSNIVSILFGFALLLPSLAIGVRRLHDIGRSGWWWFICLVPFFGSIILLVFWLLPSKR